MDIVSNFLSVVRWAFFGAGWHRACNEFCEFGGGESSRESIGISFATLPIAAMTRGTFGFEKYFALWFLGGLIRSSGQNDAEDH